MSLFQKFAVWAIQNEEIQSLKNREELAWHLKQLGSMIAQDNGIFDNIKDVQIDPSIDIDAFANIINLLSHPDEAFQAQGLTLLLGYDSKALWDALMLGVAIDNQVHHSSFKMTPGLNRALFRSPYYDYSGVRRQVISVPFADDLLDLERLINIEELHIQFWGELENRNNIFQTLEGLEALPKLKKLVVVVNTALPFLNFPDQNWIAYMQNIEELVFHRANGRVSVIDYSFVDSLPNLKKLTITGLEISYQNAQFIHQPELVIFSGTSSQNGVGGIIHLLPQGKKPLRIKKLVLNNLSQDYPANLSFLSDIRVDKLILSNVPGLYGLQTLRHLSYELELIAQNVSKYRLTWNDEILQEHGADNLEDLLNDQRKWEPVLTSLKDVPED